MKNMNIISRNLLVKLAILTLFIGLTGCMSLKPMALKSNAKTVDVSSKSVMLVTLDVFRSDRSRFVPNPQIISFERPDATGKPEVLMFKVSGADIEESNNGHYVYILSMDLEPGQYKLRGVSGDANAFPFHGFFFVPLNMDIQIQKNTVTYAGRVKAELRPRQENEFRAGSVVPLIDQAVTGVSSGTFDVAVEDLSRTDIPLFNKTYPALAGTKINTTLLPPFNRPQVQLWWEKDYVSMSTVPAVDVAVKAQ